MKIHVLKQTTTGPGKIRKVAARACELADWLDFLDDLSGMPPLEQLAATARCSLSYLHAALKLSASEREDVEAGLRPLILPRPITRPTTVEIAA